MEQPPNEKPFKQHKNVDEISKDKICVIPDCGKPAAWKGLCPTCYGAANEHVVKRDEATWEELAEMGLALVPRGMFLRAYNRVKDEKTPLTDEQIISFGQRMDDANFREIVRIYRTRYLGVNAALSDATMNLLNVIQIERFVGGKPSLDEPARKLDDNPDDEARRYARMKSHDESEARRCSSSLDES